jgi:hypothetical protein
MLCTPDSNEADNQKIGPTVRRIFFKKSALRKNKNHKKSTRRTFNPTEIPYSS